MPSALHFVAVGKTSLRIAEDGPMRFHVWQPLDSYRPRAKWGAAIFNVVAGLGAKRKTEDNYFETLQDAVAWLELMRACVISTHDN
jgi:hypothetical protein